MRPRRPLSPRERLCLARPRSLRQEAACVAASLEEVEVAWSR
jgi:hypothetical protein